jgi:hypothetical protein
MTARKQDAQTEAPVYRYEYVGTGPATFPALTGLGIGEVEPGADVEVPEPVVHIDLEPKDKATRAATAELVAWAAALEDEANGVASAPAVDDADQVDDEPGDMVVVAEPDTGDTIAQDQEH